MSALVVFLVPAASAATPWWSNGWTYRLPIVVTNPNNTSLLPRFSVKTGLDSRSLIAGGQLLANCSDLRLVYFDGTANHELDRIVNGCGTPQAEVWFALQRPLGAGAQDDSAYYVYYGNPAAGVAPSNGMNVFLFYEDWENGTLHWTSAGGLDPANTGTTGTSAISTDKFLSPGSAQEFTQKTYGGDAFTGFIPVTPNTAYILSVWATSDTGAYFPVGFDPYDATYARNSEVWLWTSEWTLSPEWTQRSAPFVTRDQIAFIKVKSEWWGESPGTAPVYTDNLVLRYSASKEVQLSFGAQESTLPGPLISNIVAISPIDVGTSTTISAFVDPNGTIVDSVTLRILSPEVVEVPMLPASSDNIGQTWEAQFTPAQGGIYTFAVRAHATNSVTSLSSSNTFVVTDTQPPQIALISVTDPIPVNNLQTLVVQVTDNGHIASVNLNVDGAAYPMSGHGNTYSYSWRPTLVGTNTYTVVATDTMGNASNFVGSFDVQAREADVCTWHGCRQGAESFSIDDGYSSCRIEMEAAGFRGTYYVPGDTAQSWYPDYSAAGHEIASHTVTHPCNTPCCFPTCTMQSLSACPYTASDDFLYRENELEPNISAIEGSTGKPVLGAAWPCGCVDPGREVAASSYFLGARGFYDYVANLTWVSDVNYSTPYDVMNLWAASSYDQSFIDRAASEGKWAIIVSHGDCTGIDYMGLRKDTLWAAPVGEVLKYIAVRNAASFTNYNRSSQALTFDVVHNLPGFQRQKLDGTFLLPIVYDNSVTLKVHILDSDNIAGVQVDGSSVPYSIQNLDGAAYVTFDASIQNPRHVSVVLGTAVVGLSGIAVNPTSVVGSNTSTGTVTLGGPAPAGGAVVALSSDNPAATVPASVTVAASATTASFTVTTTAVSVNTTGTISGTYNSTTQNATLTVTPVPVTLSSVTVNPASVVGGNPSTGTVTLGGPGPTGGIVVALSSNNPAATVPASVTVAAGTATATFTMTTTAVSVNTTATISGTYNGTTQNATLMVTPATLSSVAVNPTSVVGGSPSTGTVTLSGPAPTGGIVVALTSSNTAIATVPPTVTVAVGARSTTFTVTTNTVSSSTSVTIAGSYNGTILSATLTLTARTLSRLTLSPTSVVGGTSSTGTVTLSSVAPAGGAVVALTSSNTSRATVPGNVTVAAGATTATFTVTSVPVSSSGSTTITASYNNSTRTASLTVNTPSLSSLVLNPTSVKGGMPSTGIVTLSGPAPAAGAAVTLSSSNTSRATVPSSLTVPPGSTSATFTVTTFAVTSTRSVTISGYRNTTRSATLTTTP